MLGGNLCKLIRKNGFNHEFSIFQQSQPYGGENHQLLTLYIFVFHLDTVIPYRNEICGIRNPCRMKTINCFNPKNPLKGHPLGFSTVALKIFFFFYQTNLDNYYFDVFQTIHLRFKQILPKIGA